MDQEGLINGGGTKSRDTYLLLLSINEREPWKHKDGQSEEDLGLALFSDKPSFARRPSPHVGTVNIDVVVGGLLGAFDVSSPRREEAGAKNYRRRVIQFGEGVRARVSRAWRTSFRPGRGADALGKC